MELFGLNGCYEFPGNVVVKSLERRNDSSLFKLVVAKAVARNKMVSLSVFNGCC